ncbi:MAG: DUF6456 domain-containing protein [Parvibaculales bacterium]
MQAKYQQVFHKMARRLSEPQSFLLTAQQFDGFGLMVARNRWKKPVMRLSQEIVQEFVKADLLVASKKVSGVYFLSQAGQGHYLRQSNDNNFQAQHVLHTYTESGNLARLHSPIDWLRRHNGAGSILFTEEELSAAERLITDYEISMTPANMSVDLTRPLSKNKTAQGYELPNHVLDASRRVDRAFDYIGEDLSDIVKLVCCQNIGFEMAEKKLKWPRRSAKLVLKFALRRLAEFYAFKAKSRLKG